MMNDLLRLLRDSGRTAADLSIRPEDLASIIHMVEQGQINASTGKDLLEKVDAGQGSPAEIVEAEGLARVSDAGALRHLAEKVIAASPDQVATYRSGKATLIGWFVGQVMRESGGKADPQKTRALLEELLGPADK